MVFIILPIKVFEDVTQGRISKAVSRDSFFPIPVTILLASIFIVPRKTEYHAHREQIASSLAFVHIAHSTALKLCALSAIFNLRNLSSYLMLLAFRI